MPVHKFQKTLIKTLGSVLRNEGFTGSGPVLRRINLPIIHVFWFEAYPKDRSVYLSMGAHLDFLPPEGSNMSSDGKSWWPERKLEEFSEPSCAFRERIVPPGGPCFGWPYLDDEDEMLETIEFIFGEWECVGHAFYSKYEKYPHSFNKLIAQCDPDNPVIGQDNLTLSRIALHLGQTDRAKRFAERALVDCPEEATLRREALMHLISKADVS